MNSIEVNHIYKTCRICLNESDNMKWIFANIDDTHRTFVNILENVMNISLKLDDTRPQQVCNECQHIILMADDFKRKCLRSEAVINCNFNGPQEMLTKAENELENPYQCSICMMKFSDLLLLGSHVLYHQKDVLLVKTTDCESTNCDKTKEMSISIVKKEKFETITDDMFDNNADFDADPAEFKEEYNISTSLEIELKNNHFNTCSAASDTKNEVTITCLKCKRIFENLKTYNTHTKEHHKGKTQKNQKHHKEISIHKCTLCKREFKKKSKLLYHIKVHDKATLTYPCKICKLVFKHQAFLENHVLALHTKDKGHECKVCTKSFATEESLNVHKESHKHKKHYCKFCEKGFVMLSTMNDHMRTHTGEKPFLCNICGKNFSQKNNMLQHVRRHKGLKSFGCDECEKSFVSKGELVAHQRKHSGAHPFICDHCGNGFTTASSLVKHKRIHTGEKPYACDLCSMRFSAIGTLKNHRRRHTGEKPYQCSYCEKAFVQKNDLVSHIRCHTGERPYVCTNCGQSFRKSSALKTHIKTHIKATHLRDNLTLMQDGKIILNTVS